MVEKRTCVKLSGAELCSLNVIVEEKVEVIQNFNQIQYSL